MTRRRASISSTQQTTTHPYHRCPRTQTHQAEPCARTASMALGGCRPCRCLRCHRHSASWQRSSALSELRVTSCRSQATAAAAVAIASFLCTTATSPAASRCFSRAAAVRRPACVSATLSPPPQSTRFCLQSSLQASRASSQTALVTFSFSPQLAFRRPCRPASRCLPRVNYRLRNGNRHRRPVPMRRRPTRGLARCRS